MGIFKFIKSKILSSKLVVEIKKELRAELNQEGAEDEYDLGLNQEGVQNEISEQDFIVGKSDFFEGIDVQFDSNEDGLITKKYKPIGKFVRESLDDLIRFELLDSNEVNNLQKIDYSKQILGIQYPFLRKVRISDVGKIERYWKKPVEIDGASYYVCSEWYEKEPNNDRPYFERWLRRIKKT